VSRQSDYIAAVLADAPVAYYPLNDLSGQPQDASGNGHHTTTHRDSTTPQTNYSVGGPGDGTTRAMQNQQRTFVVPAPVMTATDNFTLEAWVGSSTGQGGEPAVPVMANGANGSGGTPGGGANGYSLGLNTSKHISIDLRGGSGTPGTGTDPSDGTIAAWGSGSVRGSLPLGGGNNSAWSHLLVIRRAGNWEYWVDTQSESPAFGASLAPTTPTAETTVFNGHISFPVSQVVCHVAFYDHALSSARILAHFAIFAAGPDGDYPFLSLVHPGGGTQQPATGRVSIL
jgi:hypothetical protein